MKKILLSFLLLTTVFLFNKSYATHVVGSEISYQCTGTPNVYLVTLKLYRDCANTTQICNSCPTNLSPGCTINMSISGAGGSCNGTNYGQQSLTIQTAKSGFDVIQLCNTAKTICDNCGTRTAGTFMPGVEVFTFQGNINLTALPGSCCQVRISYNICCRNSVITTLNNPTFTNFYSEAIINKCAGRCNASPVFSSPMDILVCNGVDQNINIGAVDPDGDSLSYALGASLSGPSNSASYVSPYSATAPFSYLGAPLQSPPANLPTGIRVDKLTGDIQFRPIGTFVSNMVVEVKQWQKVGGVPTLMGTTRRDYQINSVACPANTSVVLKKYDTLGTLLGSYGYPGDSLRICPGQSVCRVFSAADSSLADTTDLSWNAPSNMPGATFIPLYNAALRSTNGPRQDSFKFCWTAPLTAGSLTPYIFLITGKDRFCSVAAKTLRSIAIYVNVPPLATINKIYLTKNTLKLKYTKTNTVTNTPSLTQWQIETLPGSNTFTSINSDSVNSYSFPISGRYRLRLLLSNPTCGYNTIYDTASINFIYLSLISKKDVICRGDSSGSAEFTSVGGAGPTQYKINNGAYQSSNIFNKLIAGSYLITVIDSFYNTDTLRINITEPATSIGLSAGSLVHLKCKGDSIGSATLTVSNGTAPFQYKDGNLSYKSGNVFSTLMAGLHVFTVSDSNNCHATASATINEPVYKLTGNLVITNPLCFGGTGSAVIYAGGGNTPYQYKIDAGGYNLISTFSNLLPKAYIFTIKDWNGCEVPLNGLVVEPSLLTVIPVKNNITCNGLADGKVTLNTSGATPPYQFKKNTGNFVSSNVFANLIAGTYTFTIKDTNNCTTTVNSTITQPPLLTKSISATNASCLGATNGTATLIVNGGVLPYTITWNTTPVQTGNKAINLPAGLVKVTVTDSGLCSLNDSIQIGYKPLYNAQEICAITTDTATGKNTIVWNKVPGVGVAYYTLYAGTTATGTFNLVDSQAYNNPGSFIDNVSPAGGQPYYYYIKTTDSCGNLSNASPVQRPIKANLVALPNGKQSLSWNTYVGANSPLYLSVLRSVNGGPFIDIKQLPLTSTSYIDSLAPGGLKRYLIELTLNVNCTGAPHVYSNMMNLNGSGIFENKLPLNAFSVYPNPSNGTIYVRTIIPGVYLQSVEIFNLMGAKVKEKIVTGMNQETSLDLDELADGMYNVMITEQGGNKYSVKLILSGGK